MARQWRADDSAPSGFEPWAGIRIVDAAGATVADLSQHGKRDSGRDPWATVSVEVDPGIYYLRMRGEDGRESEQSVVVSRNWRTDVHAVLAPRSEDNRDGVPLRMTILMHRRGSPATHPHDRMIDQARVALTDERLVLGGELEKLLVAKFENPIAGIVGGHLLLVEHDRNPGSHIKMLDEVVRNLRKIVGKRHPDVEALSLRCLDPKLRTRAAPDGPPMFSASWQLLVEASRKHKKVISRKMWERVHALAPFPPLMVWATDSKFEGPEP